MKNMNQPNQIIWRFPDVQPEFNRPAKAKVVSSHVVIERPLGVEWDDGDDDDFEL